MQHIIKKQVIDVEIDRSLDSFHTQELLSRRFRDSVVPRMEKTFDAAADDGEVLIVDSLVIDMGVLTGESLFKDDWIIELNTRLEKLIAELKVKSPDSVGAKEKTLQYSIFNQWLYYMQNGYLPWNTLKADENWYAAVLDAMAGNPDHINELLGVMRNDTRVVDRMVAQHPDAFLQKIVRLLTRQDQGILKTVFGVISDMGEKQSGGYGIGTDSIRELRKSLWKKILTGIMQGMDVTGSFARSGVREFLNSRNLPGAILERFDGIIPDNTAAIVSSGKDQSGMDEKRTSNMKDTITRNLREDGIFTANAGLVLLHPFLKNFFTRLQITKNNVFADQFQWQKALYLLHYLATGSIEAAEHELVIPRVLCAYPEEETVDQGIPVSPAETVEADDMLAAVISQWEILKNTSVSGLREGFLQRGGKLFIKDDQLFLQVESSGIDILLDRLPWSLVMIKLPWMETVLRVEWR